MGVTRCTALPLGVCTVTSIAASPPWLLAYGGNDNGLQTGPLKEVQLESRYAPLVWFYFARWIILPGECRPLPQPTLLTHLDSSITRWSGFLHLTPFLFGELPGDRAWTLFLGPFWARWRKSLTTCQRGMVLLKDGGDIPGKFAGMCGARLSPRGGIVLWSSLGGSLGRQGSWPCHGATWTLTTRMGPRSFFADWRGHRLSGGHSQMRLPYVSSTLPSSGIPMSRCMPFWLENLWDTRSLWRPSFVSGKTKKAFNSRTRTLDFLMIRILPPMTMIGGTGMVGMMVIGNHLLNLKKVKQYLLTVLLKFENALLNVLHNPELIVDLLMVALLRLELLMIDHLQFGPLECNRVELVLMMVSMSCLSLIALCWVWWEVSDFFKQLVWVLRIREISLGQLVVPWSLRRWPMLFKHFGMSSF